MSTTAHPQTFECVAGIRSDTSGNKTVWIRSPRTGHVVNVSGDRFTALPSRLLARIVKTRSEGGAIVAFTRDELAAFKATSERPKPQHWIITVHPSPDSREWGMVKIGGIINAATVDEARRQAIEAFGPGSYYPQIVQDGPPMQFRFTGENTFQKRRR